MGKNKKNLVGTQKLDPFIQGIFFVDGKNRRVRFYICLINGLGVKTTIESGRI